MVNATLPELVYTSMPYVEFELAFAVVVVNVSLTPPIVKVVFLVPQFDDELVCLTVNVSLRVAVVLADVYAPPFLL